MRYSNLLASNLICKRLQQNSVLAQKTIINFETRIGFSNWHFNELYSVLLDALVNLNDDTERIPSVQVALISKRHQDK